MRKRFHTLKRFKIRQDWSKENLFNLSRLKAPSIGRGTLFQQKWIAKRETRGYHGEQVRERQWERMFKRRIPAVVPMDASYLATTDGSEIAAGRGSGVDNIRGVKIATPPTPYMQHTFWPIERRLDTAIFRALFASSTRQARQFVVHGHVRVNGKKMVYPGYLLNPGDMFQVDVERVMWGTGAKKHPSKQERRRRRKEGANKEAAGEAEQSEEEAEPSETAGEKEADAPAAKPAEEEFNPKTTLKNLLSTAKTILTEKDVSANRKKELRAFSATVKKLLSHAASTTEATTSDLESQLSTIMSKLNLKSAAEKRREKGTDAPDDGRTVLAEEEQRTLEDALALLRENPIDESKPYLTPWRPKDYMSAFAFIPRYLEVNQNVCAAVYLRHPAARPGMAEIPSPFAFETNQLAFQWYLRRR